MSGPLPFAALALIVSLLALLSWWDAERERQQRVRRLRQIEHRTAVAITRVRAQYETAEQDATRRATTTHPFNGKESAS
jgi:hypothetical protein